MKKYLTVIAIIFALSLVSTSCINQKADYVDDGMAKIDFLDGDDRDNRLCGSYTYPDDPAAELRGFLIKDIRGRGLPLVTGTIQQVLYDGQERMEFMLSFTGDHDNSCVVSFNTTYYEYGYPLSGTVNPSFTIAFKDQNRSQDMVTVLTSVIRYLSPGIALSEAERLATNQDDTISIDGYSIPQDIGGYQVQSHYTYPYVYFTTGNFTSSLGVTVHALKQIWRDEVDMSQCRELSTEENFKILNHPQALLEDDNKTSRIVYADFTVVDWWEYQEPIHSESETWVTFESPYGKNYILRLDHIKTPYEFGVGLKYTVFIYYYYGDARIKYALQFTH